MATSRSDAALLAKVAGGSKKKAKGLPKRTGKRKAKFIAYAHSRQHANKLGRIIQRNGLAAAEHYAELHDCRSILRTVLGRKSPRRQAILTAGAHSPRKERRLSKQPVAA